MLPICSASAQSGQLCALAALAFSCKLPKALSQIVCAREPSAEIRIFWACKLIRFLGNMHACTRMW